MLINRTLKLTTVIAAALGTWLAISTPAHALMVFTSPFGDTASMAIVHRDAGGHWIAWFPGDHYNCDRVAYHYIGGPEGLPDDVLVRGTSGNDWIVELDSQWELCDYHSSPIITNGHELHLQGGGGNDELGGMYATLLWGGPGDDTLSTTNSSTVMLLGQAGDDRLKGWGSSSQETYVGGSGTDCFMDWENGYTEARETEYVCPL